ncbi:trichohyalin-like [Pseudophryne corroboree]|uniref:trichohyalin-like n=1 Tax=Pseudophryne corroboree TaxID=495146 RepID=UPI003081BA04
MVDTVQEKDSEFEDSAEDDMGLNLQMHLLSPERSDERHRDHCDYLLDALDEQLDQLQSQSSFKASVRNTNHTKDTSAPDKEQLHEVCSKEPKDANTFDSSKQKKDTESKKDEYKWRLAQLLGLGQTDGQGYQSDTNSAESVCTEDFAVKFNQGLIQPIANSRGSDGKTLADCSEGISLSLPLCEGSTADNFSLNTARREDILQQFKDELGDDLQAALTMSVEDKLPANRKNRRDSVESLGGRISRLSQANISEPIDLLSLEKRSSAVSRLSSRGGDEHQEGPGTLKGHLVDTPLTLHARSSEERRHISRTDAPQSFNGYQAARQDNMTAEKLEPCLSEEPAADVSSYDTASFIPKENIEQKSKSECKKAENTMSTAHSSRQGSRTDTLDAGRWTSSSLPHSKNVFLGHTKEDDKNAAIVSQQTDFSVLPSHVDRKDVATRKALSSEKVGREITQTNCNFSLTGINEQAKDLVQVESSLRDEIPGSALYKHVAGIALKSFDAVTVDSDLDSVTTERVQDHIRKALSSSKRDPGHNARRYHRSGHDRGRYTDPSKESTDDEDDKDFDRTFSNTEWRSGSPRRWSSSPLKSIESSKSRATKGIPSDLSCSPEQVQSRRITENLATERAILEETVAKLRRDITLEEERLSQRKVQAREADQQCNDAIQQKKEAYHELESLRDLLEKTQKEVAKLESHVRESQITDEEYRSELVILEYKRNKYLKELQELEVELESIQQQCSNAHSSQIANFQYEISTLTMERDELMARVRHMEGSLTFMERQELERQLANTKSELFSEQRTSRAKIEKLQESLEESQCKLEETSATCAEKQEKNKQLKSQLRELEKKYQIQFQTQEEEASVQQEAFNQQITDLNSQIREQSTRIASLEKILSEKELDLLKLRDLLSSMKAEKEAQMLAVEAMRDEHNKGLAELHLQHQQDRDLHIVKLKEEMHSQKQREIQQFAENMEQVKAKALKDQAEALKKEMENVVKSLELKDKDIAKLKETLKSQKESMKKLAVELKQEAREMVHNTLVHEQKKWDSEKRDALQIQRHTMEEERLLELADLREALERERRTSMTLEKKSADLQNIIQEHEIYQRTLQREKQEALDELRAVLKEEKQEEMRRLEDELAQEKERDIERLKLRMQQLEEEQHVLRAEKNESIFREREALAQAERAERALAREISAACERIQCTTGKPNIQSPSRSKHGSPSRLSTNQALHMLHGVSEETNQLFHELHHEVEAQKRAILHVQREKERELQQLKEQFQLEKEKALEMLKERLIQEHIEEITNLQHDQLRDSNGANTQSLRQQLREKDNELRAIQRNMAKWKDETATKLARKFEEELNAELEKSLSRSKASESYRNSERVGAAVRRLSLERRENSHLRSASTPSLNGPVSQHDSSALKILHNLQGRVRELRTDNRLYHGGSMDDLSRLRTDLGNSYREKRPIIMERSMSQIQGSMRK